jgi:glycosyltransferase involved in cell wall biosynthesis
VKSGKHSPKVVFVNRYFFPDESATSRMVSDLAFRLAERGVSVRALTSRQLYENSRAGLPAYEEIHRVCIHRVATATRGRARLWGRALDYASFHLTAGFDLIRLLRPGDVVVAKTDPPLISIVVSWVARWRGAVLINWLQDLFPEAVTALGARALPSWVERWLLTVRDRSLRAAAANVVLSEGMRERLISRGIDVDRVRVIPNWADIQAVRPLPTHRSLTRKRLGLEQAFVVGYSGNLGRAHEFETLLGAARLLRTNLDIAFLITGGGAKAAALRQAVEAQGLSNFVFQEYQPAELLSDSLAAADVHFVSLMPSMEGLIVPSKIYGILAAGRPAVFVGDAHTGDVARLIRGHGCGIAVQTEQSSQLAAELCKLRDDPQLVAAMGARARSLAESRFSSEHAVRDWLNMLRSVSPQVTPHDVRVAIAPVDGR